MVNLLIFISVYIPQPDDVLPLIEKWIGPIHDCLYGGIDYANALQPDGVVERWFWAHCARFETRKELLALGAPISASVPNAAIAFTFDGIHTARLVRSLWGSTPNPGRNRARRRSWVGIKDVQQQFRFPSKGDDTPPLPPLSLVLDWHQDDDDSPIVHCSLTVGPWQFKQRPRLHWRVPLSGDATSFVGLRFDTPDDGGEPEIVIDRIDLADPGVQ